MTRVLLLLGSPKGGPSTSKALLDHLGRRLRERGAEVHCIHLNQTMIVERYVHGLMEATDRADVVVLAFPLYIDGVPSNALRAMEKIADHQGGSLSGKQPGFAAISNSGFPEAVQSDTALATCRQFAQEAGFNWLGGLALGGGGAIDGRPLEELGARARNVRRSLDVAADALASGETIPQEAVRLMAKPIVPSWLYRRFGNAGWRRLATAHGARNRLGDHPSKEGEHSEVSA
jgi:multimeric flavodoxin WrbA